MATMKLTKPENMPKSSDLEQASLTTRKRKGGYADPDLDNKNATRSKHSPQDAGSSSVIGTKAESGKSVVVVSQPLAEEMVIKPSPALLKAWKNKITDQDPAVAFDWSPHLADAVQTLNATQPPPALPAWAGANFTYPLTVMEIRRMLMIPLAAVTSGGNTDDWLLAPNTAAEEARIMISIGHLQLDPFVQQLANACGDFVAKVHLFLDRKARMTSTRVHAPAPQNFPEGNVVPFV